MYELTATGREEPFSAYPTVGSCLDPHTRIPTLGAIPGKLTKSLTAAT